MQRHLCVSLCHIFKKSSPCKVSKYFSFKKVKVNKTFTFLSVGVIRTLSPSLSPNCNQCHHCQLSPHEPLIALRPQKSSPSAQGLPFHFDLSSILYQMYQFYINVCPCLQG